MTGTTLATSWHGVLESDGFRRALLLWVARERGLDWSPGEASFAAARETQLEKLGDLIADHVDREALLRLIDEGARPGFPIVRHQVSGIRHQGSGNETSVALADTKSTGEAPLSNPSAFAAPVGVANGQENLKPETCSLQRRLMPDA